MAAPQEGASETPSLDLKVREFQRCSEGAPSVYYWAMQPIVDIRNRVVAAEILVREKDGGNCAPFRDIIAIMDPTAAEEVQRVYATWKAEEVVGWPLRILKEHKVLKNLRYISTNLRPMDLMLTSRVCQEITKRLRSLSEADRELLRRKIVIEVTEDQDPPLHKLGPALEAWRHDLGFCLSYDDTIGDLACAAMKKSSENFHTIEALRPVLQHFDCVKVDIEWAGRALFLCHPSYHAQKRAEVLRNAADHDQVWVGRGDELKQLKATYSGLLQEFAAWALDMIGLEKQICIELSISPEDENTAFALAKLKDLGLDILGEHRGFFHFQGGPTGAKAFEPHVFAVEADIEDPESGGDL